MLKIWLASWLLSSCLMAGETPEEVSAPKILSGNGCLMEDKVVVRVTAAGSICSWHQEKVEYRFSVSMGATAGPADQHLFVSDWDGPVRTLVVKLPPIFQGRPFSQFYLFGQARCAVNHRAVSAWSEHFALQILPAPVEKYVPRPEQINFRSVTVRGRTSVYLTINFPDSGFTVLDWGTPSRDGNKFVVNTEIVHWQGITLPVISPETHRYKFGLLASGEYTFEFRAWDEPVVVYRFRVSCLPVDLNQDGQCDIADITLLGRIILGLPVLADNVFNSSYPSWLLEASDINGDGAVDITDLIQVITAIK